MKFKNFIKKTSSGMLASLLCISMLMGQSCTAYAADDGTPQYTGPGTMDIGLTYKSPEDASISAAPGELISFPNYTITASNLKDDDRGYGVVGDGVTQSLLYSVSSDLSGQTSNDTCLTDNGIQIGADETASTITFTRILDYAYIRLRIADDSSSECWYYSDSPAARLIFTIHISSADTDSESPSDVSSEEKSVNHKETSAKPKINEEANQEKVPTSTVTLSGGATVSSTVNGIYAAKTVGGTEITTDKSEISKAALVIFQQFS